MLWGQKNSKKILQKTFVGVAASKIYAHFNEIHTQRNAEWEVTENKKESF